MQVTRIGWAGTRTDGYGAMVAFCTGVLGLAREHEEPDFAVLDLPSGDRFEVFGPSDADHRYFTYQDTVNEVRAELTDALEARREKRKPRRLELLPFLEEAANAERTPGSIASSATACRGTPIRKPSSRSAVGSSTGAGSSPVGLT